jgi:hypothetical protein
MLIAAARIGDIAEVVAGYPFRGAVPVDQDGATRIVQMRDVQPPGVTWAGVARVAVADARPAYLLRADDVLFVPRGDSFYAGLVDAGVEAQPTICAPQLFRLRVRDDDVMPAFMVWQLNQRPFQKLLAERAGGTSQRIVRKADLQDIYMPLPPLEAQRRIVDFSALAERERAKLSRLVELRAAEQANLAQHLYDTTDWPLA